MKKQRSCRLLCWRFKKSKKEPSLISIPSGVDSSSKQTMNLGSYQQLSAYHANNWTNENPRSATDAHGRKARNIEFTGLKNMKPHPWMDKQKC